MSDILTDLRALVMKAAQQRKVVLTSLSVLGKVAGDAAAKVASDDLDAAEAALVALKLAVGTAKAGLRELKATLEREKVLHGYVFDVALAAARDRTDDEEDQS